MSFDPDALPRHDWTREEAQALFALPFAELLHRAQNVHRAHFEPNTVETAQLLSIKTGGCPEDCGYCSQSAQFDTGVKATKLMDVDAVVEASMPDMIRGYNEATGGVNSDTEGYHHTITLFSLRAIWALIGSSCDDPLSALVARVLASPLREKDFPLEHYNRERLFSVEARRGWVEPDNAPLPNAIVLAGA